jgi:RNA polymerase sigma-70 factor (ECF subfamily)
MQDILNQSVPSYDYINEKAVEPALQSDVDLVKRTAGGDEGAFVELYQRFHLPIYNYLIRLVREQTAAEDLLQEIFLAAWQGAARFRGQAAVKTWLFHIAHNQAVSWLRRFRRTTPLEDGEVGDPEESPEAYAMQSSSVRLIRGALNRLSPDHREVLELTFYHNMSIAEIAAVLGCPTGTVKSRMSYARRYLGSLLQDIDLEHFRPGK